MTTMLRVGIAVLMALYASTAQGTADSVSLEYRTLEIPPFVTDDPALAGRAYLLREALIGHMSERGILDVMIEDPRGMLELNEQTADLRLKGRLSGDTGGLLFQGELSETASGTPIYAYEVVLDENNAFDVIGDIANDISNYSIRVAYGGLTNDNARLLIQNGLLGDASEVLALLDDPDPVLRADLNAALARQTIAEAERRVDRRDHDGALNRVVLALALCGSCDDLVERSSAVLDRLERDLRRVVASDMRHISWETFRGNNAEALNAIDRVTTQLGRTSDAVAFHQLEPEIAERLAREMTRRARLAAAFREDTSALSAAVVASTVTSTHDEAVDILTRVEPRLETRQLSEMERAARLSNAASDGYLRREALVTGLAIASLTDSMTSTGGNGTVAKYWVALMRERPLASPLHTWIAARMGLGGGAASVTTSLPRWTWDTQVQVGLGWHLGLGGLRLGVGVGPALWWTSRSFFAGGRGATFGLTTSLGGGIVLHLGSSVSIGADLEVARTRLTDATGLDESTFRLWVEFSRPNDEGDTKSELL